MGYWLGLADLFFFDLMLLQTCNRMCSSYSVVTPPSQSRLHTAHLSQLQRNGRGREEEMRVGGSIRRTAAQVLQDDTRRKLRRCLELQRGGRAAPLSIWCWPSEIRFVTSVASDELTITAVWETSVAQTGSDLNYLGIDTGGLFDKHTVDFRHIMRRLFCAMLRYGDRM